MLGEALAAEVDFGSQAASDSLAKNFTSGYFRPVTEQPPESGKGSDPMRFAGLGVQLAASLLLFVLGGEWLDGKAGTGGLFAILGAFLALGGNLWSLLRLLKRQDEDHR